MIAKIRCLASSVTLPDLAVNLKRGGEACVSGTRARASSALRGALALRQVSVSWEEDPPPPPAPRPVQPPPRPAPPPPPPPPAPAPLAPVSVSASRSKKRKPPA